MSEMRKYNIGSKGMRHIGYAYDSMGRKVSAFVSSGETGNDMIAFTDDYYFCFYQEFYMKESVEFPSNPLDVECSSISGTSEFPFVPDNEKEIVFKLKEVLSEKSVSEELLSESKKKGFIDCYLSDFEPLYISLDVYLDKSNNIYIKGSRYTFIDCYEVINEEFKEAIMSVCFPEYA